MGFKDKHGKEIKVGQELTVPLDVFSSGVVVMDKDHNELALELKYESKKIHLKHLHENFFKAVEVI